MMLEPDDTQRQLGESVRRLLADHCSFEQRRAIVATPEGRSAALWGRLAELGVTGLLVPEAHGGHGGRMEDLLTVLQACGGALLPEPLIASGVLATTALRTLGGAAQQRRWLPAMAQGHCVVAWAHDEAAADADAAHVATRATRHAGGWVLHGTKTPVPYGSQAQAWIVSAHVGDSGREGGAGAAALFIVEPGAAGSRRRDFRLVDETPACELQFDGAAALPMGDPLDAEAQRHALEAVTAAAIAALCADMVGAAEAAFRLSMEYLRVRQQFGRAIGENQALRHRAADMLVSLEMARSMALAAAVAADHPGDDESAADLHRAKLVVGRQARAVCHHAIQCHGGIGMTEEYAVGHCLRRVHVADHLFGDAEAHARRLAERA